MLMSEKPATNPPPPDKRSQPYPPPQAPWPTQPPSPPAQAAPPKVPRTPVRLRPAVVALTVASGVAGNLALRQNDANTLIMSCFVALLALALNSTGFVRSRSGRCMLITAGVFASLLMLRTEPRLIVFNLLACALLLVGAAAVGQGERIADFGPVRLVVEALDAIGSWIALAADIPLDLGARLSLRSEGSADHDGAESPTSPNRTAQVVRGLLLAAPVVLVLGKLLAQADAVFSSLLSFDATWMPSLFGHMLVSLCLATVAIALQRKSSRKVTLLEDLVTPLTIGKTEAATVLISMNVLFGLFALSQVYALTGAADRILAEADLSVKDYARQGFFQLLWVAGITLVIIVGIWTMRRASEPPTAGNTAGRHDLVVWQIVTSVVLTLGIVAVAVGRLQLYIADSGLTPLRLYSTAFSIWIAVGFLIVLVRVFGVRPEDAWLAPALLASGLLALLALNLANPEAIIASHNLDRYSIATGQADQSQADSERVYSDSNDLNADLLTGDGHVVLARRSDDLPEQLATQVLSTICEAERVRRLSEPDERSLLGFNFSEVAAHEALSLACAT